MDLANNFDELLKCDDVSKIKENWFKFKKFDAGQFNITVPLCYTHIEDDEKVDELINFVKRILKLYPTFYPKIVLLSQTNNFRRDNRNINKKFEERCLSFLEFQRIPDAAEAYALRTPEKLSKEDIKLKIQDTELAEIYYKLNDLRTREMTIEMILHEILFLLKSNKKFSDIIIMDEKMLNLARLISLELYLRTKAHEKYIEIKELSEAVKSFQIFKNYLKKKIEQSIINKEFIK